MLIFQSCAHLPVHSCLEMLRLRLDQNCTYSARATGRTSKKVVWFCTCNHSRCTSNPTPARAICDVAQATLLEQNSVARATIHVAPATRWTARAELRCTSNSSDCTCRTVAPARTARAELCCTSNSALAGIIACALMI